MAEFVIIIFYEKNVVLHVPATVRHFTRGARLCLKTLASTRSHGTALVSLKKSVVWEFSVKGSYLIIFLCY